MYVEKVEKPTVDGAALAVLHNSLEVSAAHSETLMETVGEPLFGEVHLLTVDRSQQWDWNYKQHYYSAIIEAPPHVGQVKLLDKLDNLYLLCLNPDDEVRSLYLTEIERWVVPLAEYRLPSVAPLLGALVVDNRRIGHVPLESWNLELQ
jgi:(p)ppGpp synthase/HD superfamily hydrolase